MPTMQEKCFIDLSILRYTETSLSKQHTLFISHFRRVLDVILFLLGLKFMCRRFVFIGGVSRSASEDGGECSETSARKFQTPGNHQKERIQQHNPCFFNLENYTLKMEAPGSYETLMCKYKTVTGELDIREVPDFILWVRTRVSFT